MGLLISTKPDLRETSQSPEPQSYFARGLKSCKGYTIVELMIVLAVTGVLAFSAFGAVVNQRANTEFSQAVRAFEHELNDIANDVNHGFFPKRADINVSCFVVGSNVQFSGSSTEQGANDGCMFVGKAVHFRPNNVAETMNLYTLAGRRIYSSGPLSGSPIRSLYDARPKVARTNPGEAGLTTGLTERITLPLGLRITGQSPNNLRAVVFATSLNSIDSGSTTGSPTTKLYTITHGNSNVNPVINQINNHNNYSTTIGDDGVWLCVELNNRRARIHIGARNHRLTTTPEILGRVDSC
ncbi:hypothetical protein BH23PAT1_BH23PAT1_3200 [soil metagenome]